MEKLESCLCSAGTLLVTWVVRCPNRFEIDGRLDPGPGDLNRISCWISFLQTCFRHVLNSVFLMPCRRVHFEESPFAPDFKVRKTLFLIPKMKAPQHGPSMTSAWTAFMTQGGAGEPQTPSWNATQT